MDADRIARTSSQLVPRRTPESVRLVGTVRIPIAGPYRPWARLYLFPDGRLVWLVRVWQLDRPVTRLVRPHVLRAYAERSGLVSLATELDRLVTRGRAESRHAAD